MYVKEGIYTEPELPAFIIVEARRTNRLVDTSSEAELFGHIKSQLIRKYVPPQPLHLCFLSIFGILRRLCAC
jgi:hypothetical protein